MKEAIILIGPSGAGKSTFAKIHNEYITPELNKIDGYLRGLYKNLNK